MGGWSARICAAVGVSASGSLAPAPGSQDAAAHEARVVGHGCGHGEAKRREQRAHQRGGGEAARAVVVRAAEREGDLRIGLRPPCGGDERLLAGRQLEGARDRAQRPGLGGADLGAQLLRAGGARLPAGADRRLGALGLRRLGAAGRRGPVRAERFEVGADGGPQQLAVSLQSRSRRDLHGGRRAGDLAGAQRELGRARRGRAGIVTSTWVGGRKSAAIGLPSRNTSTSAAAWTVSSATGAPRASGAAGPGDDRHDGQPDRSRGRPARRRRSA